MKDGTPRSSVAPDESATVERFMSAPDVPTVPSILAVPPEVFTRKWAAVPVVAIVTDAGSAAVSTPPDDVNEPEIATVARRVPDAAVSGVAGFVPDRISIVAADPMSVASAAPIAWTPVTAIVSATSQTSSSAANCAALGAFGVMPTETAPRAARSTRSHAEGGNTPSFRTSGAAAWSAVPSTATTSFR